MLRIAGFGGAATTSATNAALQIGQLYGNARQYGVEGFGASRIAAGSEALQRAFGQGDFWNEIGKWLLDMDLGT